MYTFSFLLRSQLLISILIVCNTMLAINPDSLAIVEKLTHAKELIAAEKIDSSTLLIQECLPFFRKNDDLFNWIHWQKKIGHQVQHTVKAPLRALEIYQDCLNDRWRTSKTPNEFLEQAWLLVKIGYVFKNNKDDLSSTRDYYLWASKIFADTLGNETAAVAHYVYRPLGSVYSNLYDFENAKIYYEKSKDISYKERKWDKWADVSSDLGRMYSNKNDSAHSISIYKAALHREDSLSSYARFTLLNNLGRTYYRFKDYNNALIHTDLAKNQLYLADISDTKKEDALYDLYVTYGRINKGLKAFKHSEDYYSRALDIINSQPNVRRSNALMNINLGTLYLEWEKPQAALKEYHTCLNNLLPGLELSENFILPKSKDLTNERLLINVFDMLAKTYIDLHKKYPSSNSSNLAIQCYQLASEVEELMLQEYYIEGSSLTVLKNHREYKENALANLHPIWEKEQSPKLADFIFKMSERSRAILLLENFHISNTIKENRPENKMHLETYHHLRSQTTKLEQAVYTLNKKDGFEKATLDSLKKKLNRTKEELASVTKILTPNAQNNYDNNIDIKSIQSSLTPDQLLIEYFVGEKHLFIIAITKNDFHVWKKDIPIHFEKTISNLIQSISSPSGGLPLDHKNTFAQSSSRLHTWLLKEVLEWKPKQIDRLIIIPDGLLSYIPFELLISEKPQTNFYYNQLGYLIRDHSVSYAPSASLYVLQSNTVQKRAQKSFAGFAPKYKAIDLAEAKQTDNKQLKKLLTSLLRDGEYDLPGAVEEVRDVRDILNGDQFIHQSASESTFKKVARDYQILLLSMHSFVNEENSNFSTLAFTQSSSKEDDDYLHAIELSNLDLQADLAVLSACNTGYGKMNKGEGVMSFSRAFLAAGVPSTLMTLWKVPDHSSSKIVNSFFQYIEKGLPKDKALQQAKLSYLLNAPTEGETRPEFWGGFIAAGNMEALDLEVRKFSFEWIIMGCAILIILFLFVFRKKISI